MSSTGSRSPLVHPSTHPRTQRDTTPRPPPAAPNIRTRPACEPASPSYAGLITSPKPTRSTSAGCSLLIPASAPRGTPSKTSTSSCEADNLDQANQVPRTVRRSLRHRTDTRIQPSREHHHRMGRRNTRLPHQQTSNQRTHRRHQQPPPESYAESPTASQTPTITQPEESS